MKVSIYIPSRNRKELLLRAVYSCLMQSYADIEVIVCLNNDSSDALQTLSLLSQIDRRLKVFSISGDVNAQDARNKAIKEATGSYVTGLDDDDYFSADRIAVLVDFAAKWRSPESVAFLTGFVEDNGITLKKSKKTSDKNIGMKELEKGNIIGNQIFIKTQELKAAGGFDRTMSAWQDFDCWLNLASRGMRFIRVDNFSYYCDVGHHETRISSKTELVRRAKESIVSKYDLGGKVDLRLSYKAHEYDAEYHATHLIRYLRVMTFRDFARYLYKLIL
jgi:glycosyltransferase involved in cell wall biosynthesis